MQKIVTVTFNPAIDKSTTITTLIPEKKLKCSTPFFEPGGGGINVSRALNKLGVNSKAIYLAGGYSGNFFRDLLKKEIAEEMMVEISNHTRENMIVYEASTALQYRFGMPGPLILEHEWKKVIDIVENLQDTAFLVASGSISQGIPTNIFALLATIAKKKNIKFIVDTSGEPLKLAMEEGVFFVKPNLNELSLLSHKEEISLESAAKTAREFITESKCEFIIVSLGAKGAMLVSHKETIQFIPPELKRLSTVGAGDSMVAGIVKSLSENYSIKDAVKYGVACGSAATMNPGTELCKKTDADKLFSQITEINIS